MKTYHERAYTSIMNLGHTIGPFWQQMLSELNLTPMQSEVIFALTDDGVNIRRISELLGVTSSAATQQVEALEKRGIVLRATGTIDRRVVNVKLTKEGKRIQDNLVVNQKKLIQKIVGTLSKDDVDELVRLHSKMMTKL